MKLLAIDTSTDACSVALLCNSEILLDHRIAAQQHGLLVIPMIDGLMANAGISARQLDGLIFGRGPGSFTGVRIGVALAQGIALGADIGVLGISTLQSIAQGTFRVNGIEKVAVCLDARMKEVYFATFRLNESGLMRAVSQEYVCSPQDLQSHVEGDDWSWAGNGAELYSKQLNTFFSVEAKAIHGGQGVNAQDHLALSLPIAQAGELLAPEDAMPIYLRNKVADTTAEREAAKSQG